ncbi:hypothetical protein DFJ73DRAFT_620704 [Zopfochytrium polystomum]|nr:hypothetical protein DFJ73DRAFT_620704 [Zopfochytrium polystomum]
METSTSTPPASRAAGPYAPAAGVVGTASSSNVFIKIALDQLSNAKESKRFPALKDAIKEAQTASESSEMSLDALKVMFHPLRLACQSRQPVLTTIAIDCLGKLFSYGYWSSQSSLVAASARDSGIIADIVETICDAFSMGENTDDKVQLQIVKALLAAVTATNMLPLKYDRSYFPATGKQPDTIMAPVIHGATLLRAVRTTYNIFLLSKSSSTQIVAQASLTQIVQGIFSRVPKSFAIQANRLSDGPTSIGGDGNAEALGSTGVPGVPASVTGSVTDSPTMTAATMNSAESPSPSLPRSSTSGAPRRADLRKSEDMMSLPPPHAESELDLCIQDAYLVLRAMCKLSMKPIPTTEGPTDLKSHAMRSKLLSLHLVHSILSTHVSIFFTPAPSLFAIDTSLPPPSPVSLLFIHSVKQYLCLTLSRNALSVVPQVFDISMDIFSRVLVDLRTLLKKELSVIFTEIIIPIVEAKSSVTFHQRVSLFRSLGRLLADPGSDAGRLLVEIFLNYDCDVEATSAKENIWERLISSLSRALTLHHSSDPSTTPHSQSPPQSRADPSVASGAIPIPPAITTANLATFTREQVRELYSSSGDYVELKKRALEVLVRGVLKPLVWWCTSRADANALAWLSLNNAAASEAIGDEGSNGELSLLEGGQEEAGRSNFVREDDPSQFETLRQRKQILLEGITRFNTKPKKGIQFLLESGFIASRTKKDIAMFLLTTEGLSKSMIGEFLGEGDEEHIAIMHAFVEELDFVDMPFLDAIRHFLQHFRLPGEAQKIDRLMLKFAERFHNDNPNKFATADTAYVLAFSVIMLNSDQHNPQVKKRMTKADFLKNNSGIDDGKNLDPEFLGSIFDDIKTNEIILKEEHAEKAPAKPTSLSLFPGVNIPAIPGIPGLIPSVGQAQFDMASESVALKTEALFNNIMKSGKRQSSVSTDEGTGSVSDQASLITGASTAGSDFSGGTTLSMFYSASHYEHVRPMFQGTWMSILTAISGSLQETEDAETVALALEGFRHAIWLTCMFDLELERKAFVSTLAKFTQLGNVAEMKQKSIEAIKALLTIGHTLGNRLSEGWMDIVQCVSQLERLQILDANANRCVFACPCLRHQALFEPALLVTWLARSSTDLRGRKDNGPTPKKEIKEDIAAVASSQSMTLMVDKIFTSSVRLSGPAIVLFVRALCSVSWDEICASATSEHPRMYCLQRLVEISYYNMRRIRFEWVNIWAILGPHFNMVGSHSNPQVCFFALDKLRQLAAKFLEIDELPNFKFQKDFLRPFEYVMGTSTDPKTKDMVLTCLQQMIQAKASSLKSGWKAIFGALSKAAQEERENLVLLGFDLVKSNYKANFETIVSNLAFSDCITCLVEFCKNKNFPKTSLQSIELLKQTIPRIYEIATGTHTPRFEKSASTAADEVLPTPDEANFRVLFPILFALYEVVMTGDLEVRTRGLQYLFETIKQYGDTFSADSWEVVTKGVLFPIFDDLKLSKSEHTKFANKEDFSVWLSTTLIQALRLFVELFGVFYTTLQPYIDGMFDLLVICMTQENETLARIGSTCLQSFVESNAAKFDEAMWDKICREFRRLFELTTPDGLFFDYHEQVPEMPDASSGSLALPLLEFIDGVPILVGRRQPLRSEYQGLIVKCVLHLLVIQTLQEVLLAGDNQNPDVVLNAMSGDHVLDLLDCLERSYNFARAFNRDMELRIALYRMGFMKQLPNLLKQETSSIAIYITVLVKLFMDTAPERVERRSTIGGRLLPLFHQVIDHFHNLDVDVKKRNVTAWKPAVISVITALAELDDERFKIIVPEFYMEVLDLLLHQDVDGDIRTVLYAMLARCGGLFGIVKVDVENAQGLN